MSRPATDRTPPRNPPRVAICMPAYNEASGIIGFLREIAAAFADFPYAIVVVDDCSDDGTSAAVAAFDPTIRLIRNQTNLGHGASTMIGLREALSTNAPRVLAVDGDGQVPGADLRRVFDAAVAADLDVAEGVRIARDDPSYRQFASAATRLLVRIRCGTAPADANTPVRCYRSGALRQLLLPIPADALTPNLFFSVLARTEALRLEEVPIAWLPRRGDDQRSVTWQGRAGILPSRRFATFSGRAAVQWLQWR